jgi:hypothetical protein
LSFFLIEDGFERVVAELAATDEPFVVRFDHDAGGESEQGAVVGEDADDVGAAADLAPARALVERSPDELSRVLGRVGVETGRSSPRRPCRERSGRVAPAAPCLLLIRTAIR